MATPQAQRPAPPQRSPSGLLATAMSSIGRTTSRDSAEVSVGGNGATTPTAGGTKSVEEAKIASQQAQHSALIASVLAKATKIRKDSKARRHRDLQKGKLLDEAVEALTSFQDVEWPPRKPPTDLDELPEWMSSPSRSSIPDLDVSDLSPTSLDKKNGKKERPATSERMSSRSIDREEEEEGSSEEDEDEESGEEDDDDEEEEEEESGDDEMGDAHPTPSKESVVAATHDLSKSGMQSTRNLKPASRKSPPKAKASPQQASPIMLMSLPSEDQDEDAMHPASVQTLEAMCFVMRSESKTPRMCELALECIQLLVSNGYVAGVAGTSKKESNGKRGGRQQEEESSSESQSLLDYLIESIAKCSESSAENVHVAMTRAMLALMTSSKCGVHEAALLVSVRSTFHVYLVSKSVETKDLSKSALLDMLKVVFNRMEAYDAVVVSSSPSNDEDGGGDENQHHALENGGGKKSPAETNAGEELRKKTEALNVFASQYHTDGYLLFRALCKLSAKALPEEEKSSGGGAAGVMASTNSKILSTFTAGPIVDPLALNSKVLSLELILAVFEHCGDAFRNGEKFIYAVQNYLCVSLLKNCMSVHTEVAFLSLKIFLALVYNFKDHLKSEIEVFVANIFLRVLESPNSSFDQKAQVLKALRALCSDSIMLTQLFLNYDCDFDAVDLYKNIVYNLTRVSGKTRVMTLSRKEMEEEGALCKAGLEVLVVILQAFLKVLKLPGGDDEIDDSISPLRSSFQLDIGQALVSSPKPVGKKKKKRSLANGGRVGDDAAESSDVDDEGEETDSDDVGTSSTSNNTPPRKGDDAVANQIIDGFDRKRTVQEKFETGIVKFTLSFKSGLLYFVENDFVSSLDANEIAVFLHKHQDRLDKTQIGEVLGKEPESRLLKDDGLDGEKGGEGFYVRVLHHYVYTLDFHEMDFDTAIRTFLAGFRLPGEAQKIDRIMEKFAERYTRQNEEVFPSADTAFILAFSIIMLNTDLHNPSIKPERRMTVESFIRNNRGIAGDGGDLPEDYLTGIFKRIEAMPFTLKEDDDAREKEKGQGMQDTFFVLESRNLFGASVEERKKEKFRKEREEMMAASEGLFRKRPGKGGRGGRSSPKDKSNSRHNQLAALSVSPTDVVKPMFDVTWGPLIGTLSQILETTDDQATINLCLNAFVYSVRIASHSNMSLARDTFVNSLTKFTTLGSIKEMKYKNIESIQTLLSIAVMDGEYLGESWGPVLQCISHLARLQLFASGLEEDDKFFLAENDREHVQETLNFFQRQTKEELARETENNNAQAVLAAVNEILIDKVYSSTVNLSARSMHHFIEQLVNVSAAEISGNLKKGTGVSGGGSYQNGGGAAGGNSLKQSLRVSSSGAGPRIFSLQKLVEVADYNMDARPRIAWTQMWELMAKHFATIGCHENAMVSMFAIDALRQLSFKFLQKPELYDFNFQRVFLRPFLHIMENPGSREDIRELILRCVDNLIRAMSKNLRSGWKIFFSIIVISAEDPSEKISTLGLAILQRLLDEHLDELCGRYCMDDYDDAEDVSAVVNPDEMTPLQRKIRNASAEDFVGLCQASLSFVQTSDAGSPMPIGLSMRAICHTACYADLIANGKVLPPVTYQVADPKIFGYTYEGLTDREAEEMVLWRPILDGLATGLSSNARSNSGGVGCLVQRGSLLTLRAILLRHGSMFSIPQWSVILRHVILPAFQRAAEYDESPVAYITSESPTVSSVDFLSEPLPLPPKCDDKGLRKFAEKAQSDESAPSRPLGAAELLVEASFADLRHGGDGDLSRAFGVKRKSWTKKPDEQPFPDSWVATTAPVAVGMLIDIASQYMFGFGAEGRDILWPIVLGQLQLWILGPPVVDSASGDAPDDVSFLEEDYYDPLWRPGEALARIGSNALNRMFNLFETARPTMDSQNSQTWCSTILANIAETLLQNSALEETICKELLDCRVPSAPVPKTHQTSEDEILGLLTPFGQGRVLRRRIARYEGHERGYSMREVALEWGATLHGLDTFYDDSGKESFDVCSDDRAAQLNEPDDQVDELLPRYIAAMKIRCVVAYVLQQRLPSAFESLVHMVEESDVTTILDSLESSRKVSASASSNRTLSLTWKEALLIEYGDNAGLAEGGPRPNQKSNRGGSEMFLLTQEAGATRCILHLISLLYCPSRPFADSSHWDREAFAGPILVERIDDVLSKFIESEKKDGHLVDPNVWQKPSEISGNVALYCTAFAGVVVCILQTVIKFSPEQFRRQIKVFYPLLCALVQVQSGDIRQMVSIILSKKVAPLLGLGGA